MFKQALDYLNKSFGVYNIRGIDIEPRYWMALALGLLTFLLVVTLARLRYLYVHWSMGKSAVSMLFWGFVLALIVEGFFLVFGRTLFTQVLGWESPPKPVSTLLSIGRGRLINVLGVEDENIKLEVEDVVGIYKLLSPDEAEKVRDAICR